MLSKWILKSPSNIKVGDTEHRVVRKQRITVEKHYSAWVVYSGQNTRSWALDL